MSTTAKMLMGLLGASLVLLIMSGLFVINGHDVIGWVGYTLGALGLILFAVTIVIDVVRQVRGGAESAEPG